MKAEAVPSSMLAEFNHLVVTMPETRTGLPNTYNRFFRFGLSNTCRYLIYHKDLCRRIRARCAESGLQIKRFWISRRIDEVVHAESPPLKPIIDIPITLLVVAGSDPVDNLANGLTFIHEPMWLQRKGLGRRGDGGCPTLVPETPSRTH